MLKVIKQYTEFLGPCPHSFEDNLKRIEQVGRICYQSQDKVTDNSYIGFCDMLARNKHAAMIEHSNLVLNCRYIQDVFEDSSFIFKLENNEYKETDYTYYGNYRAFMEALGFTELNQLKNLLHKQVPENKTPNECKAYTVIFHTNRAVTHELVRHRPASFAQLSQRYVSHTGDMKIILPVHYYGKTEMNPKYDVWFNAMEYIAEAYKMLRDYDESPQQARTVLTNSTHTQIAITAYPAEWRHIFSLRCSKAADPQMQEIMIQVRDKFLSEKWV